MSGKTRSGTYAKLWHFEPSGCGLVIVKGGKELKSSQDRSMGLIKDVTQPLTRKACSAAASYIQLAVEVEFKDSLNTAVLNVKNFEWNHLPHFNSYFKGKVDLAADFIQELRSKTFFDIDKKHLRVADAQPGHDSRGQKRPQSHTNSFDDGDHDIEGSSPASSQPPQKQPRLHENELDDNILSKRIGIYQLPIGNLMEAEKDTRLVRSLDNIFLKHLKERIAADPSGPGVPPIIVLCKDAQEGQFAERLKDVYKYEVQGGQHTTQAKAELHKENPNNPMFKSILVEIYVGLSDDESLRLASRHNANGHFIHKMTHRDYVEACRAKLFALNDAQNEEVPSPTPQWKKICTQCILPESTSRSQRDNIFSQASLATSVWKLAQKVMDMFENSSLKDQKPKKNLLMKPEFKQQYLQPIQSLPVSFQEEVLASVIGKEISLGEVKEKAAKYRSMQTIRRAFCKCTNTTWTEAQERFPSYATDEQLGKFSCLSFIKDIPNAFVSFCKAALQGELQNSSSADVFSHSASKAYLVTHDVVSVTYQKIREAGVPFHGANLFITIIPEDAHTDTITKIAYTSRQLNTLPEAPLNLFNICFICNIEQIKMKKDAITPCYDHVEVAYWHNKKLKVVGEPLGMVESIGGVVIGHFSIDGTMKKDHFNRSLGQNVPNMFIVDECSIEDPPVQLMSQLVQLLTYSGQTIVDTTHNGSGAVASLRHGRNGIVIGTDTSLARQSLVNFSEE